MDHLGRRWRTGPPAPLSPQLAQSTSSRGVNKTKTETRVIIRPVTKEAVSLIHLDLPAMAIDHADGLARQIEAIGQQSQRLIGRVGLDDLDQSQRFLEGGVFRS